MNIIRSEATTWHTKDFQLKYGREKNGRQIYGERRDRVTRTITVAICYCFLLQQTAIIPWYIITSNYFKLNKRCATIRLWRNGKEIIIKIKQTDGQTTQRGKNSRPNERNSKTRRSTSEIHIEVCVLCVLRGCESRPLSICQTRKCILINDYDSEYCLNTLQNWFHIQMFIFVSHHNEILFLTIFSDFNEFIPFFGFEYIIMPMNTINT